MDSLPPEDRAPEASPRRVPIGLLAAAVLATVVVVVAVLVAVRSAPASDTPPSDPGRPGITIRTGLGGSGTDLTGQPAPKVGYSTFDDAPASLDAYRGRPLVINFWSSTCAPCTTEMPAFQRVHEQVGDDVAFLGIDVTDSPDNGQAMLRKTGVKYDVGRDPHGDMFTGFGAINLPTTVFVGADGTIKFVFTGELSQAALTDAIDQHLRA